MQILCTLLGILCITLGIVLNYWSIGYLFALDGKIHSFVDITIIVAFNIVAITIGCWLLLLYRNKLQRLKVRLTNFCLVLLSTALMLAFAEGGCRLFHIDIGGAQRAFAAIPIPYRQPTVPVGEIFFRRPENATWSGAVLSTLMRCRYNLRNAFPNEPTITLHYDSQGFRNSCNLHNWQVAVVGDSFVELGHLPDESLITTQLSQILQIKVKNIGTSYTGTLTHNYYLQQYAASPSLKHSLLVFFEGNDIDDLAREARELQHFQTTGKRNYRQLKKSTSLLKAVYRFAKNFEQLQKRPRTDFIHAYFPYNNAKKAVSLLYAPPAPDEISAHQEHLLNTALHNWAVIAHNLKSKPWLVYMPCKHRILREYLQFADDAPAYLKNWQPNNLPSYIKALCRKHAIQFIDATPALLQSAKQGTIPYVAFGDTHLNQQGAKIVATVVADSMRTLFQ